MGRGHYILLFVVDDDGNPVDAKKYRCRQTKVTLVSNKKRRSNKNESNDQYPRSLG